MLDIVEGGVKLRAWQPADAATILAAARQPLMSRQFAEPVETPADAEAWIAARLAEQTEGTAFAFAVLNGKGDPVGNVAVSDVSNRHLTGWVSYWLMEQARGQGLATRACQALAQWSFTELSLFRLELAHRTDNPPSCRVATAAGFTPEGIERAKLLYDEVRYDVERHARLATDPPPPHP